MNLFEQPPPGEGRPPASAAGPSRLMDRLLRETVPERVSWNSRERRPWVGVLAPGIDEPEALAGLLEAAQRAVRSENLRRPGSPVRLCLALHEGLVSLEDGEFDGPAITAVRALARGVAPRRAPLLVVCSLRIFDDLAALGPPWLRPDRFRRLVDAAVPALAAEWDEQS
ncbi:MULTISPECIES: hypothetical protein [Thermomonospora]|nr:MULTISPECIES: hypothetical protein [Thermomonospora]